MRDLPNRQATIQRMRAIKRNQHAVAGRVAKGEKFRPKQVRHEIRVPKFEGNPKHERLK